MSPDIEADFQRELAAIETKQKNPHPLVRDGVWMVFTFSPYLAVWAGLLYWNLGDSHNRTSCECATCQINQTSDFDNVVQCVDSTAS